MITKDLFVKAGVAALLTAAAVAFAAQPAAAHTPYVVPITFSPERDYVAVQGGLSKEAAFVPDFAIRGGGEWIIVAPDGASTKATPVHLKSLNVLEVPLPAKGTYRIGTGDRPGRALKFAKVNGAWRVVRPAPAAGAPAPAPSSSTGPLNAADVPAGAEVVDMQSYVVAETYVSRGAPSTGALKTSGKGFELEPVTHPNEIFLDEGFTFRALVDGKPVNGLNVTVFRGGEGYQDKRTAIEATTAADGKATVKFDKPGIYMLETRYPGATVPGAAPSPRVWIYSLSFEVTQ